MSYPTAVLDIGTSKVVCLFGARGNHGLMEVYGTGFKEHGGLRKQTFLNQQTARDAIFSAIRMAEEEAQRVIRTVSIGTPDSMLQTVCTRTPISYHSSHKLISTDFDDMVAHSLELQHQGEMWLHINSAVERYEANGANFKKLPVGTVVSEWTGIVSNTYFRKEFEAFVRSVLIEMNIEVETFVDAVYAEAMLLCSEEDCKKDIVFIDIGYYQTNMIVLRNQTPIYRTCIEAAGYHVANDIHYVLDIVPTVAEELKRRHVFGLNYMEQSDTYQRTDGSMFECNYEMIQNIIESRALEIADLILIELDKMPIVIDKSTKIFVSGGGILMMQGGREFLQTAIEMPVEAPKPVLPKRNSPNYYSAYGVLQEIITRESNQKKNIWKKSFFQGVIDFFTK